jgi:hypothetical protein
LGVTLIIEVRAKHAAIATLLIATLGVTACGESSEQKATKQVCSARKEITAQVNKLQTLPRSSSFPTEAKASFEAMRASVKKMEEAAPNLPAARKEEINAANKAFQTSVTTITKAAASATESSNLEAALKTAEPQIRAALSMLASEYKKAFEALKCS